ncbi:2'-5' RNA ligase family protein [Gandjariella thermophila]|uniref:2'-5' RNA ligase n=1 Tax=Gandjariella thermophila TaxID=1931992 RepID=A0A4D4JA45_9PSEU|nr:2'-5' RNA ligase family protein [Gandjariella thermophila]GDY30797.1 2'-5' RNA ligase [Gandjariella thermophila]
MAHALDLFFDDEADVAVRALWRRLERGGVPSMAGRTHRPHVTFARAGSIPRPAREALRRDLSLLALPNLWLSTLATFPTTDNALWLGAVVDTELLAVHSAVHDVLAGRVRQPSAYHLPGAWVPHCLLTQGVTPAELATGFATLHPVQPIRAAIRQVGITDTRTGEIDVLLP